MMQVQAKQSVLFNLLLMVADPLGHSNVKSEDIARVDLTNL
jgi:hypothetical protein